MHIHQIQLDLTDKVSIENAVASILDAEGRIDVLVNNAGIVRGSNIEETDMDAVREMFETNFFGTAELIKNVVPGMRQRRSGTIVNVTSIAGRLVSVSGGYYAASKYAFEALSESLTMQLAPFGVRVKIIEPGATTTSMLSNTQKATRPANPNSPYKTLARRFGAYFDAQLNRPNATPPDAVAQVIERAIATDDPKLRYVVGDDSETLLAGRQSITDEDAVAFCQIEDDEEYYDAMQKLYGRDLFRRQNLS